jgi:hypothetical protein
MPTASIESEERSEFSPRDLVEQASGRFSVAGLAMVFIGWLLFLGGLVYGPILKVGGLLILSGVALTAVSLPGFCYLAFLSGAYDPVEDTSSDVTEALRESA